MVYSSELGLKPIGHVILSLFKVLSFRVEAPSPSNSELTLRSLFIFIVLVCNYVALGSG